jgi:hypothetical protein
MEVSMSNDEGMAKYGVQLDEDKVKESEEGQAPTNCPICLEELDDAGACPKHGTEPFEPTGQ